MGHAADAVLEIFSWIGFAGAGLFGLIWLIAWAADGSWAQVEVIVDRDGEGAVVRWFGADGAHSARLSPDDEAALDGADEASVWSRIGRPEHVRLTRRPPVLRLLARTALGLAVLGLATTAASIVVLFIRG